MFNNRTVISRSCNVFMTDTEVYVINRKTNVKTVYATSYKNQSVKVDCKYTVKMCIDVTESSHKIAKTMVGQFTTRNVYEGKKVKYLNSNWA